MPRLFSMPTLIHYWYSLLISWLLAYMRQLYERYAFITLAASAIDYDISSMPLRERSMLLFAPLFIAYDMLMPTLLILLLRHAFIDMLTLSMPCRYYADISPMIWIFSDSFAAFAICRWWAIRFTLFRAIIAIIALMFSLILLPFRFIFWCRYCHATYWCHLHMLMPLIIFAIIAAMPLRHYAIITFNITLIFLCWCRCFLMLFAASLRFICLRHWYLFFDATLRFHYFSLLSVIYHITLFSFIFAIMPFHLYWAALSFITTFTSFITSLRHWCFTPLLIH